MRLMSYGGMIWFQPDESMNAPENVRCPRCREDAPGHFMQSMEGFHHRCAKCRHEFLVPYDRRPKVSEERQITGMDGEPDRELMNRGEQIRTGIKVQAESGRMKVGKPTQVQKVTQRIEDIFAHAAALDQSGRLRNTIYCMSRRVYILNQDFTVLLRFVLRPEEAFAAPCSFRANDYDSREFRERDGKIEFVRRDEKWTATKSCSTPERTPEQVGEIYQGFDRPEVNSVVIGKDLIPMLNEDLSHVEISGVGGKLQIVQRNIYDGTVLTITPREAKGLLATEKLGTFGPLGIRTPDLIALYSFAEHLRWRFAPDVAWFESTDPKLQMTGLISQCIYDELGRIEHGREESEERRDQQSPDRPDQKQQAGVTKVRFSKAR
jgi:hypothetical protein